MNLSQYYKIKSSAMQGFFVMFFVGVVRPTFAFGKLAKFALQTLSATRLGVDVTLCPRGRAMHAPTKKVGLHCLNSNRPFYFAGGATPPLRQGFLSFYRRGDSRIARYFFALYGGRFVNRPYESD